MKPLAFKWLLWLVPLFVALFFVARFASPLPITDEWFFLRNSILMKGFGASLTQLHFHLYNHPVYIPVLYYLGVGNLVNYDARAFIATTLICFLTILLLVGWRAKFNAWEMLVGSAVVFGLGHWHEFLWGNQFTLAFSTVFPIAGIAILDASLSKGRPRGIWIAAACCIALTFAGVASSAGGIFGFLAAVVLVLIHSCRVSMKIFLSGTFIFAFLIAILLIPRGSPLNIDIGRVAIVIPTALGGLLIGTEVGVELSPRTPQFFVGSMLMLVLLLLGWRTVVSRHVSPFAFPAALVAFGIFCSAAIAVGRPYLGNWHLQYVIPAVLGILAGVACARRVDTAWPFRKCYTAISVVVFCFALLGTINGFYHNGPFHAAYADKIGRYASSILVRPNQEIPYPQTGGWNIDRNMVLFLYAAGNEHFQAEWGRSREMGVRLSSLKPRAIVVETLREPLVFEGERAGSQLVEAFADGCESPQWLLIHVVFDGDPAEGIDEIRVGNEPPPSATLRRVDSRLVLQSAVGMSVFSGFVPRNEVTLLSTAWQ